MEVIHDNVKFDDQLEAAYVGYQNRGRSIEELVLGDATYERRFKMPKWNGPVTMLQEPKVAIRHNQVLGISTSKNANRQRAEYFTNLYHEIGRTYTDLANLALETYGNDGPQVSGIIRSHFPRDIKDRLRFLSAAKNATGDAARLHEYLAKTRSPLFR